MFRFLFGFKGRVNRAKFWVFYLCICFLLSMFMGGIIALEQQLQETTDLLKLCVVPLICWPNSLLERVLTVFSDGVIAIVFYSALAVIVKRLHDRGKSAWWLTFFYGIPIASFALMKWVGYQPFNPSPKQQIIHLTFFVVSTVIIWWYLIEILFLPGTRGENRFGPDARRIDPPKDPA